MRKDVFGVIDSMIDKGEKIDYSKIARQYDCDYRMVKKYYRERNDKMINILTIGLALKGVPGDTPRTLGIYILAKIIVNLN